MIILDKNASAKHSASRSDDTPISELIAANQATLAALATLAEDMKQAAHRCGRPDVSPKGCALRSNKETHEQRHFADTRVETDSLAA